MGNWILGVGRRSRYDGMRKRAGTARFLFLSPSRLSPRVSVFPSPLPLNDQPIVKAARNRSLRWRECLANDILASAFNCFMITHPTRTIRTNSQWTFITCVIYLLFFFCLLQLFGRRERVIVALLKILIEARDCEREICPCSFVGLVGTFSLSKEHIRWE